MHGSNITRPEFDPISMTATTLPLEPPLGSGMPGTISTERYVWDGEEIATIDATEFSRV